MVSFYKQSPNDLTNWSRSKIIDVDGVMIKERKSRLQPTDIKSLLCPIICEADVEIYDFQLWYHVLRHRSNILRLDISDSRIKNVVQKIFSKTIDRLSNINKNALIVYLYLCLNVVRYDLDGSQIEILNIEILSLIASCRMMIEEL